MPSPFPGMDPYLEDPVLWPGVHQRLVTHLADTLNELMPRHYVANIEERVYLIQPDRSIYPDVAVVERGKGDRPPARGGTAVAAPSDPAWIIDDSPEELREAFVQILPVGAESQVITVIEVMSHANKAPGSHSREKYVQKQQELIRSDTALIEIDWLHAGAHTVAASEDRLRNEGRWDYLVCLHRPQRRWHYEIWPTRLPQRLPIIRVPLGSGDPDVELDLQPVLDRCYDRGAYDRRIDYRRQPSVPLSAEDTSWTDALLRQKGLRPGGGAE